MHILFYTFVSIKVLTVLYSTKNIEYESQRQSMVHGTYNCMGHKEGCVTPTYHNFASDSIKKKLLFT